MTHFINVDLVKQLNNNCGYIKSRVKNMSLYFFAHIGIYDTHGLLIYKEKATTIVTESVLLLDTYFVSVTHTPKFHASSFCIELFTNQSESYLHKHWKKTIISPISMIEHSAQLYLPMFRHLKLIQRHN